MQNKQQISSADVADRHRWYMALALLALGFTFIAKALEQLVQPDINEYLDYFQLLMVACIFGLLAPVFFWKVRHRNQQERAVYFRKDGFAAEALHVAQRTSWLVTFIVLVVFESMDQLLASFSTAFFLQVTLALLLCTMSGVFLFKIWPAHGPELEPGDAPHA